MDNRFKIVISILIIIAVFSGGIIIGDRYARKELSGEVMNKDADEPSFLEQSVDFRMFWQVWNLLQEKFYYQPVGETALFYGALQGLVDSLEDPYTVFFTPENAEEFKKEIEGQFEGIGAEIGIKHDQLTIIAPLPGSPAEKAGLRSGDKVAAIDGLDTTGIYIDKAVSLIRGAAGTTVVLTIFRDGMDELLEVEIERGKIDMVSVRTTIRPDDIAYIEIFTFAEDTNLLFVEGVEEVINSDVRGIIVDLRGNSGGYLDQAVDVLGQWIGTDLAVIERNSQGEETKFFAKGSPNFKNIPTVVLVNQGTASGSEIVAGALQDYDSATIVGKLTFGKGSIQEMEKLKDGSAVKITVAEWLTPLGRSFNEVGIEPDIEVELTDEDYNLDQDPQLDKALEILLGQGEE